jgi:hypothetical protein
MDFFRTQPTRSALSNENHMKFSMPTIPGWFRGGMAMEDAFPQQRCKYHIYNIIYIIVLYLDNKYREIAIFRDDLLM